MKKYIEIILWLVIFAVVCSMPVKAQNIGDTSTPYDTTGGWDAPEEFTGHYGLPIYRLLSNPGGWINISQRMIDSLFYALIVYTDSLQHVIRNDTLINSPYASGIGAFSSTDSSDTVIVLGLDSLDIINVSARGTYNVNDILKVQIKQDTLIVNRNSSGTSGLKYDWIWKRKYQ